MSAELETELLELSQRLLDSIDQRDWQTYTELCDESLTAFEPEAVGSLVVGMQFHRFYFDRESDGRPVQSSISSPQIRILGEVAVVLYTRLTQRLDEAGCPNTTACEETRVWQQQDGRWQHVHFHRSKPG